MYEACSLNFFGRAAVEWGKNSTEKESETSFHLPAVIVNVSAQPQILALKLIAV